MLPRLYGLILSTEGSIGPAEQGGFSGDTCAALSSAIRWCPKIDATLQPTPDRPAARYATRLKLLPCHPATAAGALAAYGVLRAMSTVLESIHALPHLYAQASVKKLRFGHSLHAALVRPSWVCSATSCACCTLFPASPWASKLTGWRGN